MPDPATAPAPDRSPAGGEQPVLRPAHAGDIDELVALEARLFGADAWDERSWWAELRHRPRREYVVAEGEGGIDGYAGLDHGGQTADVMTVAVHPDRRGTGLGRRLLDELVARARRRGARALLLEVRADNEPALALYRRRGFEQIQVRRRYYQPGDVDALVLRLLL